MGRGPLKDTSLDKGQFAALMLWPVLHVEGKSSTFDMLDSQLAIVDHCFACSYPRVLHTPIPHLHPLTLHPNSTRLLGATCLPEGSSCNYLTLFLTAFNCKADQHGHPVRLQEPLRKLAALKRLTRRAPENAILALLGIATLVTPHLPTFLKI